MEEVNFANWMHQAVDFILGIAASISVAVP